MISRSPRGIRIALCVFAACSLLFGLWTLDFDYDRIKSTASSKWPVWSSDKPKESNSTTTAPSSSLPNGNETLLQLAGPFVEAIMTPEDATFDRLECPAPKSKRYEYLRGTDLADAHPKYFFALDLHQCVDLLPRLIGSIVETMRFLGPHNCALSIVEGRSDDGTYEVLKMLSEKMSHIGARYFLASSDLNPSAGERIERLAALRNMALKPLTKHPEQHAEDSTIIFINDVALCMEDILELIHQRFYQGADMTCGMDWTYVGPDPTFYDVWIARGMNGDTFFNIPEDGNWNSAWNLFWNNHNAQSALHTGTPFQVYACWNGATVFTAKPFLKHQIKFRAAYENECPGGEPKLFCKDMWYRGYGKIAVIPSVNIEYGDEAAKKIKALKGYVSRWTGGDNSDGGLSGPKIKWESSPPENVKCMPGYDRQIWKPWDDQLAENDDGSP